MRADWPRLRGAIASHGDRRMQHARAGVQKQGNQRRFEPMMLCGARISDYPASRSTLPAAAWQVSARTLLCALALTCLFVSMGAQAQSTNPITRASSGPSAGCADVTTSDTVRVDVNRFRCLTARDQAASLRTWIESRSLLSLTD